MAAPETNCQIANNHVELSGLEDEENFQTGKSTNTRGSSNDRVISKSAPHRLLICSFSLLKSISPPGTGRWTPEEHKIFLKGINDHGKGWKRIAAMIVTRNVVQVRTHAQKYFQKLNRMKANESETEHSAESSDEKEVPAKQKRKSSKDESTDASMAKRSRKRPAHIDLANLSTEGNPSPTCVDGIFSNIIGEDGTKILSFPDGFVDDWFLQEASGSASPFTSVDEYEDSSLSGEDDGTVNSRSNTYTYQSSYYGGVTSVSEYLDSDASSVQDVFGHSFDEDVLDSGILEIFGH